jgi:hypothetical protein
MRDRGQATLFPECLDDWIDEDVFRETVRQYELFVTRMSGFAVPISSES